MTTHNKSPIRPLSERFPNVYARLGNVEQASEIKRVIIEWPEDMPEPYACFECVGADGKVVDYGFTRDELVLVDRMIGKLDYKDMDADDHRKSVQQAVRAAGEALRGVYETDLVGELEVPIWNMTPYCRDWELHPGLEQ